jgi:hypothetical protein
MIAGRTRRNSDPVPGRGSYRAAIPPIGLTTADLSAGGKVSRMQTTGASQYVVERRSLVRVLVAAHDCRRPQVLLYLAAVRDGPSPNGGLPGVADRDRDHDEQLDHACDDHYQDDPCAHAQLSGYGGGWAIASSYRRLHTWQVASLGLNSGMSR